MKAVLEVVSAFDSNNMEAHREVFEGITSAYYIEEFFSRPESNVDIVNFNNNMFSYGKTPLLSSHKNLPHFAKWCELISANSEASFDVANKVIMTSHAIEIINLAISRLSFLKLKDLKKRLELYQQRSRLYTQTVGLRAYTEFAMLMYIQKGHGSREQFLSHLFCLYSHSKFEGPRQ